MTSTVRPVRRQGAGGGGVLGVWVVGCGVVGAGVGVDLGSDSMGDMAID